MERFEKKKREVWRKVYEKSVFTSSEERVLNRLAEYLEMNTNAIAKPGGGHMSIDEMAAYVHLDRSHFRRTIRSLMKKNAIGRFTNGFGDTYYMNPWLYEMGEVGELLYHQFREEYVKLKYSYGKGKKVVPLRSGRKYTTLVESVSVAKEDAETYTT